MHISLDLALERLLLPDLLQHAVEPVLHLVLSPAWDLLRYLRPLVANQLLLLQQHEVFLRGPGVALDVRA